MPRQTKKRARSPSFTWDYRGLGGSASANVASTRSANDTESSSDTEESLLDEQEWESLHHLVRCDGMPHSLLQFQIALASERIPVDGTARRV